MKKMAFAIIIQFLLMLPLWAQISGIVYNRVNKTPLTGANVYLKHAHLGTVSDDNGAFKIDLNAAGDDTLIVSFLGFRTYSQPVATIKFPVSVFLIPIQLQLGHNIVVTGVRASLARQEMPHSVAIIDSGRLQRYGSSDLAALVKTIPSVQAEGNDLDGTRIQIRGSNAGEVNVYFDGILLNDLSLDNSADLSLIPTEEVKDIKVLKGGGLILLGNGAFGGVLSIHSRHPLKSGFSLKAKAGSFEVRQAQFSLNIVPYKQFYIRYYGQVCQMRPDIEYYPGERFGAKSKNGTVSSKRFNHLLNMEYFSPFGRINGRYFNYYLNYNKSGWNAEKQTQLFTTSFSSNNQWDFHLSQLSSLDQTDRYIVSSTHYKTKYQTERLNIKTSRNFRYRISNLQMVAEYFHDRLRSQTDLANGTQVTPLSALSMYNNRASLAGIYAFNGVYDSLKQLSWRVFFGARGDLSADGNRDFTHSWGAQVHYKINNKELTPYFSFGKNVKYPTLLQQASVHELKTFSGTEVVPTSLEPEYNTSYELGSQYVIKYGNSYLPELRFNFALFLNSSYNKILARPMGEALIQTQTGRNNTKGVEFSAGVPHLLRYFSAELAWLKLDIDNLLLYEYKPEQSLSFKLDFFLRQNFFISGQFFRNGKSYAWYLDSANQLQTESLPGNYDLDITAGYGFNWLGLRYRLHLAGYNLFDNSGYRYYYLKKRSLQVSFGISY